MYLSQSSDEPKGFADCRVLGFKVQVPKKKKSIPANAEALNSRISTLISLRSAKALSPLRL